jgi:heme-degrading monooxygenase HmoA
MPQIMVRVTYENYEKWRPVFDEAAKLRKAYGSKGVNLYRVANKPNEVVIIGEYEDVEKARQLFQSQEFREATQRGGVIGQPEVFILEEVARLEA